MTLAFPLAAGGNARARAGIVPDGDPLVADIMPSPRCDSRRALRAAAAGLTGWGYGAGIMLRSFEGDPYDAGMWHGLSFWARTSSSTFPLIVQLETVETTPVDQYGSCPDTGAACWDHYAVQVPVTGQWRHFRVPFAALAQGGRGLAVPFVPGHTTVFDFLITQGNAAAVLQDGFELWLDDVAFY